MMKERNNQPCAKVVKRQTGTRKIAAVSIKPAMTATDSALKL